MVLAAVSLGKYSTKLYHNNQGTYSSSIGGLITIIFGLIVFSISLNILMSCFNREDWTQTVEDISLEKWEHVNMTVRESMEKGLEIPYYISNYEENV